MIKIKYDITGKETISSNLLTKIKESKKTLNLNYSDDNNKYSLIVDGSKLKDFDELKTGVLFDSKYKKQISKLSNYADGVYISFNQKKKFPNGVKLRLYLGNKYSNGDKINIYYYDKSSNKLVSYKKGISVKNGNITIPLDISEDYFFTMSNIGNSNKINPIIIGTIIGLLILVVAGIIIAIKKRLKDKKVEKEIDQVISKKYDEYI